MRKLPPAARAYIICVYTAGVLSSLWVVAALKYQGLNGRPAWELIAFAVLAILCGGKKIPIFSKTGDEDAGSMSLGFVLTFTSMLRFGPAPAMLIGGVACLSSGLYPRRQPLYQLAFNLCLGVFECGLAGVTFYVLNGKSLTMQMPTSFVAIVAATLVNYAINTGGVAVVIALCSGENP